MADEGAADIIDGADLGGSSSKKKGVKGFVPQLLKYLLIIIAAIILIITIVVITNKVMNKNGSNVQTVIPISEEYTNNREEYDWYTSLDQIRTSTSDAVPASVSVTIVLGYKKDDKVASTEITARRIELIDFLRRFFSEKTVEELSPKNEDALKIDIRDQINDNILTKSKIRDVKFTAKDVVTQ